MPYPLPPNRAQVVLYEIDRVIDVIFDTVHLVPLIRLFVVFLVSVSDDLTRLWCVATTLSTDFSWKVQLVKSAATAN